MQTAAIASGAISIPLPKPMAAADVLDSPYEPDRRTLEQFRI